MVQQVLSHHNSAMLIDLLSTEENAPEPTKITFYEYACDCVLQLMLIYITNSHLLDL